MTPGNICTPDFLADAARDVAQRHGMKITVLDRKGLESERMGSFLAVAQGTPQEPRLVAIEYNGGAPGAAPVALVGKGLCFDSGGISIKPAAGMEWMKFDMSGAGGVIGAMEAIGRMKLQVNVVGLFGATTNMPSGTSMNPGDVVRSQLGKYIEIVNTDAEGRLVLADLLSYVRRFNPAAVIDAATLTGACVIALGHTATGVMGTDQSLVDEVIAAGERSGERGWQLPLWDDYFEHIKSDVADIKNSGGRPAGTITAALFLKEFAEAYPWVHLDIAGTAYSETDLGYLPKGPTGVPVGTFVCIRARARGPLTHYRARRRAIIAALALCAASPAVAHAQGTRGDTLGARSTAPHQQRADSVQSPFARGDVQRTLEIGESLVYTRDELFQSGALTVGDLLDRLPAVAVFRTGWLPSPQVAAYGGDFSRVRAFYDGIELDDLELRDGAAPDLHQIPLWTLERLSLVRSASGLRIDMQSWEYDLTTPYTRVDVLTGDLNTNLYRGFYGKRYYNGAGLQIAGQQYGVTDVRNGGGGDQFAILGRYGVARSGWAIDATALRMNGTRTLTVGEYAGEALPNYRSTNTLGYLRAAFGHEGGGPFLRLIASTQILRENSSHYDSTAAAPYGFPPDTVDTLASETQYIATAGFDGGGRTASSHGALSQTAWPRLQLAECELRFRAQAAVVERPR